MMVPGMYSSLTGDLKRTSWPGGSSGRAQTLCALLNWSHWACLLDYIVINSCLKSYKLHLD